MVITDSYFKLSQSDEEYYIDSNYCEDKYIAFLAIYHRETLQVF